MLGLFVWFAAALAVGAAGVLRGAPPPAIVGTIATLTLATLLTFARVPALAVWARGVDLRVPVLFHTVRFVGILFLVLHAQGRLPDAAVAAGWGDIAVAALALVVATAFMPVTTGARRGLVFAWNALGLIDILLVIGSLVRAGIADPAQVRAMTELPMVLLPTFVVPLVLATHALIFARLRASPRA